MTDLINSTDDWFKALENSFEVCAVFFDFQKAFDSAPHVPLMSMAHSFGAGCKHNLLAK